MVGCSKENFDSYFSKLQNICTDSMNEDVKSSSAAAAAANAMDPAKGHHIQQGDAPPPLRIHWVVLLDFSPEILYSVCCLIDLFLFLLRCQRNETAYIIPGLKSSWTTLYRDRRQDVVLEMEGN